MSFVITIVTQEGIVMASDSRLTINGVRQVDGNTVVDPAVSQSDTSYKTFLAGETIGISTFGAATIQGVPLSGYIDAFILEKVSSNVTIENIPPLLMAYMKSLPEVIDAGFHIAGYTTKDGKKEPYVSRIFTNGERIDNFVPSQQIRGVIWDGESDVMIRMIYSNLFLQDEQGNFNQLPNYAIPFDMFTLQDAIDFAVYAVRVTSDTMRFQLRYKTVGGPVDVLVIKPERATWLQRKELYLDK